MAFKFTTRSQALVNRLLDFVRGYSQFIVLLACSCVALIFVIDVQWSVFFPVLGGTLGALLATMFLWARPDTSHVLENVRKDGDAMDIRIPLILSLLYISGICISYQSFTGQRPLAHYLLFGGFAGAIAYQIAVGEKKSRVVPQIVVLAFFTYWSTQLAFPAGAISDGSLSNYAAAAEAALGDSYKIDGFGTYRGHIVYVLLLAVITDLSATFSYILLATLVLALTIPLISVISNVLPQITETVALYASLMFGLISWFIGQGMFPQVLNFFYPLILLIGIACLGMLRQKSKRKKWILIGAVVGPAIVFGHQFSAGFTFVFLCSLAVFVILSSTVLDHQYERSSKITTIFFITGYSLLVFGNPLHQGPLLGRFSAILLSVVQPSAPRSASGAGGMYNTLPLDLLVSITVGEILLFLLAIFGAVIAFKQTTWGYDFTVWWAGIVSLLIIFSLGSAASDMPPHRFFAGLSLFGFNIFAGLSFRYIQGLETSINTDIIVVVIITVFAIASLASPVVAVALSPASEDIPHNTRYQTTQQNVASNWANDFTFTTEFRVGPTTNNIPLVVTGPEHGAINQTQIRSGTGYRYSMLANSTGSRVEGGGGIGTEQYVYIHSNKLKIDNNVYSNGEVMFLRRSKLS